MLEVKQLKSRMSNIRDMITAVCLRQDYNDKVGVDLQHTPRKAKYSLYVGQSDTSRLAETGYMRLDDLDQTLRNLWVSMSGGRGAKDEELRLLDRMTAVVSYEMSFEPYKGMSEMRRVLEKHDDMVMIGLNPHLAAKPGPLHVILIATLCGNAMASVFITSYKDAIADIKVACRQNPSLCRAGWLAKEALKEFKQGEKSKPLESTPMPDKPRIKVQDLWNR